MKLNIAHLRQDYSLKSLDSTDVLPDPIAQFAVWFEEAVASQILEPNAMTLATVNAEGRPSARIVLLKGFNTEGFTFFTNYTSQKGADLAAHPFAALCFNWLDLQRQVRIEGSVEKVSAEESTQYFQSRPKGSQIGAWASPQSQIIPNRTILEEKVAELTTQYADTEGLPRPEHWGGYVVKPTLVEFWQGRSSRLHDRIRYTLTDDNTWTIERLAP